MRHRRERSHCILSRAHSNLLLFSVEPYEDEAGTRNRKPSTYQKIPYDPQEVVETIADVISRSDFEFDIDELEDED